MDKMSDDRNVIAEDDAFNQYLQYLERYAIRGFRQGTPVYLSSTEPLVSKHDTGDVPRLAETYTWSEHFENALLFEDKVEVVERVEKLLSNFDHDPEWYNPGEIDHVIVERLTFRLEGVYVTDHYSVSTHSARKGLFNLSDDQITALGLEERARELGRWKQQREQDDE